MGNVYIYVYISIVFITKLHWKVVLGVPWRPPAPTGGKYLGHLSGICKKLKVCRGVCCYIQGPRKVFWSGGAKKFLPAWGPGARRRAPGGVLGAEPPEAQKFQTFEYSLMGLFWDGGGPGGGAPGSSEVSDIWIQSDGPILRPFCSLTL